MEEVDNVIIGGGICGLATALALYRKGIPSIVLERSETLRITGAGIAILTNGWRALDELGAGQKLRPTALQLQRLLDVDLDRGKERQLSLSMEEARCVKRSDLIEALADGLPFGTIRFGCDIVSVNLDTQTSFPILQLSNGSIIKAKALIGCDGANSVVSNFLGIKPRKIFSLCAVRGFTHYPNGHGFTPQLVRIMKDNILCGRVPVDQNLVFWFVVQNFYPQDSNIAKDPDLIKQFSVESIKNFPTDRIEMVENCEEDSLSLTHLRYRAPWEILAGKFRKGTVTVAGDAMHVMGPFIGQGGSAAIEDAIVLARCLSQKMQEIGEKENSSRSMLRKIGEGIDAYVTERRRRLFWLSTQTYLFGSMLESSSRLVKVLIVVVMIVLFRNPMYHTRYDCGRL